MYGLPDRLRPLSAAEEQVMLAVWACREPATRRDIDEKLRGKGWAPATVLNFLYRLEEKGWVKSGKQGNHNIYAAPVTQRERLRAERTGTGHEGAGGKAPGSRRIRSV